jgi:hypothetical protein
VLDFGPGRWLDEPVNARTTLTFILPWLVTALCFAEAPAEWTVIEQNRGITVSRREQPGCDLPSFRGQGQVRGSVLQILALMLDSDSVEHWAYGVDEAKLLKRFNAHEELIHLYSDVPWPVRDRDMIVRRRVEVVQPGREFHIHLRCEPDALPEQRGTVRVKKCSSGFHLRWIDAETTEVDYEMSMDPAGLLPKWASNYITKHVPFKTLVAIEKRAAQTEGRYETVVKAWSAAAF